MQQGILNRAFVSPLAFIDQREILKDVLDIFDEMNQVVDIMEAMGKYVVTSQEEYNLHVNTRLSQTAEVAGAEAAPSAGATTDIVVTAGSVKPRLNDILLSPARNRMYVTAVVGNTITVKPVNEDLAAHEEFTGGELLANISMAYPEGSDIQKGYIYPTSVQSNNIQIIRGEFSTTDLQAATKQEVEFQDQPYYMIKGVEDAFNEMRLKVAFTWIFGERSKGLTNAAGDPILATHGLEKSVIDHGVVLPLDSADTNADFEADFYAMSRAIDQVRGPKEYWMWNGPDVNNKFDDWLGTRDGYTNGGVVYNSFSGIGADAKKRAVEWGFDSFKQYGRTWHKKPLEAFDNLEVSVPAGYPKTSIMIPMNKVKVDHNSGMIDRFRIRYLEAAKDNRLGLNRTDQYYEIVDGGLASAPTNQEMKFRVSWTTHQGPEFAGLEHFAINTF